MKILKKIWGDPVWSKIIAAFIISLGGLVWTLRNNKFLLTKVNEFSNSDNALWWIIIVLSIFIILTLSKYLKKKVFTHNNGIVPDNETNKTGDTETNTLASNTAETENLELDRAIMRKISNDLLPQTGTIRILRSQNFAGFSFERKELDDIHRFEEECDRSDFEFLDKELESLKVELHDHIKSFTLQIMKNTFPMHNGFSRVPPEWEINYPTRFEQVTNNLNDTATLICEKYDQLIRLGRRKLRI